MMSVIKWLAVSLIALMITACSISPESRDDADSLIPAEQQIRPDSSTSTAIRRLIENARQASKQGAMDRAESFLERAIRIEPRNPLLWHYLAKIHLHQGHYQRAEGLAAKSSSLTPSDQHPRLKADNWRIIAHARQYQGDSQGAQQAQARASELSGGNH